MQIFNRSFCFGVVIPLLLIACNDGSSSSSSSSEVTSCDPSPCLNNGTCTNVGTTFSCGCPAGFYGDRCECSVAATVTRNFDNIGTGLQTTLAYSDLVVSGSADIGVFQANGLGIVGGISNTTIDGSENMTFGFTGPTVDVTYSVSNASNNDADVLTGEAFVEPFDEVGTSLGVTQVNGIGDMDVSAFATEVPLSSFVVTADVDSHKIARMTYSPLVCSP